LAFLKAVLSFESINAAAKVAVREMKVKGKKAVFEGVFYAELGR
jgi:hypothetical protein